MLVPKFGTMLDCAFEQAELSLREGGIPVGAAIFAADGALLGSGRNRRLQAGSACAHAELEAMAACGLRDDWTDCILACTHAPCLMCAGMMVQFGFAALALGCDDGDCGGLDYLRAHGVAVHNLKDAACASLSIAFRTSRPGLWDANRGD